MKIQIEELKIGESATLYCGPESIRKIIKTIEGRFKIVKAGQLTCVVVRLDPETESLRSIVLATVEKLGVFEVKRVPGDVQYIRSCVSEYNKKHDRSIKVNKVNGVATISENVMARKMITENEFKAIKLDFDTKLEILRGRIKEND